MVYVMVVHQCFAMNFRHAAGITRINHECGPLSDKSDPPLSICWLRPCYRKTSRLVHPDRNANPGAEEAMKLVNRAKEVLLDPVKRRDYDERLREDETTDPSTPDSRIPIISG